MVSQRVKTQLCDKNWRSSRLKAKQLLTICSAVLANGSRAILQDQKDQLINCLALISICALRSLLPNYWDHTHKLCMDLHMQWITGVGHARRCGIASSLSVAELQRFSVGFWEIGCWGYQRGNEDKGQRIRDKGKR